MADRAAIGSGGAAAQLRKRSILNYPRHGFEENSIL
jgi:hypothetical protein